MIDHKLLPRELWRIRVITDGQYAGTHVVASLWENPPGYVHHERIALADLPNETISGEDLSDFGIFAPR